MREHYDVLVTGGRLSAILAAALLARRGLRTLLIDQGELVGMDGSLVWDLIPSSDASKVMQAVNAELGLDRAIRTGTVRLSPAVQVVLPDNRLELGADPARLPLEFERELSARPQSVQNTTQRIQEAEREVGSFLAKSKEHRSRGFFSRRQLVGVVRTRSGLSTTVQDAGLLADAPPALAELLVAALPFVTHVDAKVPADATVGRFARPVMRFLRGFRTVTGGRGIRSLVLDVAGRRAFELKRSVVRQLEPLVQSVRVRTSGDREMLTAGAIVDASGDLSALDSIPGARKRELALTLQSAQPAGFLHILGIEVDRRVIPPAMSTQVLLLNGPRDPSRVDTGEEDRPMWITRRPASTDGREQLVLAHPVSSVRAKAEGLDHLEAIMRRRIEQLIPFLAHGDPQVRSLSTGVWPSDHGTVLPHPLYDPSLDLTTGFGGVPTRTPFRNVFVAGPSVLPGLGVEGAYRGARRAVDAVCRALQD